MVAMDQNPRSPGTIDVARFCTELNETEISFTKMTANEQKKL